MVQGALDSACVSQSMTVIVGVEDAEGKETVYQAFRMNDDENCDTDSGGYCVYLPQNEVPADMMVNVYTTKDECIMRVQQSAMKWGRVVQMKKIAAVAITMMLAVFALAGCGGNAGLSSSSSALVSDKATQAFPTIGTGSESIDVTNSTGLDITGVAVKSTLDADYPAESTYANVEFKRDAKVTLKYSAVQGAASSSSSGSGFAANALYDIKLTAADGTILVVHQLNLKTFKAVAFCYTDGLAYITYTDSTTNKQASTKEAEQAIVDAQKAAAEAEAAAAAAAQAAAEGELTYTYPEPDYVDPDPTYEPDFSSGNPVQTYPDESDYAGGDSAQTYPDATPSSSVN